MVAGYISSWIDLDSKSEKFRKSSEVAFKEEIIWGSHLGVPIILCPYPSESCYNYASILNTLYTELYHLKSWIKIPLIDPEVILNSDNEFIDDNTNIKYDSWERWNTLRSMCNYRDNLCIALELTIDLPTDVSIINRWYCEPVEALILPTSIFITNMKDGKPILPSNLHKEIVIKMLDRNIQLVISGRPRHPEGFKPYIEVYIPIFFYIPFLIFSFSSFFFLFFLPSTLSYSLFMFIIIFSISNQSFLLFLLSNQVKRY